MPPEDHHFRLRVPSDLKTLIEEGARTSNRSMNAEIVARLEAAYSDVVERVGAAAGYTQRLQEEIERIQLLTPRRIPEGLFRRIQAAAESHQRSVEEEVVQTLEAAFPLPELTFGEYMADLKLLLENDDLGSTTRQLFEALMRSYEMFASRDPDWIRQRPSVPVEPGGFPMNMQPASERPSAAPSETLAALQYLKPFIRDRNESVMQALAEGDLAAAVLAAKDAERLRDVGT